MFEAFKGAFQISNFSDHLYVGICFRIVTLDPENNLKIQAKYSKRNPTIFTVKQFSKYSQFKEYESFIQINFCFRTFWTGCTIWNVHIVNYPSAHVWSNLKQNTAANLTVSVFKDTVRTTFWKKWKCYNSKKECRSWFSELE